MNGYRILHVVTSMDYAGIETLLMSIYRNIDRTKIQFDFLVHSQEIGDYEEEILNLGGRIYRVNKINVIRIRDYENQLFEFFIKHPEYNIVHSHLNTFSKHVLKAAEKANVKFKIAHSHASMPPISIKTIIKWISKQNLNKYADYKFSCSKKASQWLYGTTDNVTYFRNSINTKEFVFNPKLRNQVREDLELEGNTLLVGHVGNFFKIKNHDFIIKVFEKLKEKEKNSKLLLIGSGEYKKTIIHLAKRIGIEEDIIFLGSTDKVNEYMQAMDVFIFPSHREGLGMVTIEAQAAGLRIVASENIPRETQVTPLITYISLKEDIEVWVDTLLDANTKETRQDTSEMIISEGYDIEKNVQFLERFYIDLSKNYNV